MKENPARAWITAVGCWLLLFAVPGALISALSLYVVPVTESLGITRGQFSLMFSMYSLVSAILSFFAFKILKKISLRLAILIGGLSGAVGCLLFSLAKDNTLFLAGGVFLGVALGLCGLMTVQLVLSNWFAQKTGLIMSISASFTGIGILVMSPIIGRMISSLGWTASFCISGVGIAVLVLLVVIFIIRDHPSDLGLLPYGVKAGETAAVKNAAQADASGMTAAEALRTVKFWLMILCLFILGFNTQVTVSQQSAMIMDKGFALETAAAIVSVYAIFNTFTKIAAGVGIEKFGFRTVAIAAGIVQIAAFLTMLLGKSHTHMVIYAVLFGASCCVSVNYGILSVPMLFGKKEIKGLTGFGNFAFYCGCLLGPVVSGQLYDHLKDYNIAIYIMMAFMVIYALSTLVNLRKSNAYANH